MSEKIYSGSTNVVLVVSLTIEEIPEGYEAELEAANYKIYYKKDDNPTEYYWDADFLVGTEYDVQLEFDESLPVPSAGRYIIWTKITFADNTVIYSTPADLRIYNPGE